MRSLEVKLPALAILDPDAKDSEKLTVSTTSTAKAPKGWLDVGDKTFFNAANQLLANPPAEGAGGFVSSCENTYLLDSEADVVRAASTYLLHPVNAALLQLCPGLAEKLRCSSEMKLKNGRVDVLWTFKENGTVTKVAVLELKRISSMRWGGFTKARAESEDDFDGLLVVAEKSADRTSFTTNSVLLTKQMQMYANDKIPDVGLFDWNSMFLGNFQPEGVTGEKKFIAGAWFSEKDKVVEPANGDTFRKFLLGFLVRAMLRLGIHA